MGTLAGTARRRVTYKLAHERARHLRADRSNQRISGHHPSGDERADAALRQFVRLLARIAVAEALGTAGSGEPPAPDLSA